MWAQRKILDLLAIFLTLALGWAQSGAACTCCCSDVSADVAARPSTCCVSCSHDATHDCCQLMCACGHAEHAAIRTRIEEFLGDGDLERHSASTAQEDYGAGLNFSRANVSLRNAEVRTENERHRCILLSRFLL